MIQRKNYASREEWLAIRDATEAIGGSEAGAILGLNPYASPYSVWCRRTHRTPEQPDNERMRQGRDLEQYVAERFSELTGKGVHRVNAVLVNDEHPRLMATIDRKVENEDAGLECKTASALTSSKFAGGEFPASYYAQVVTYLAVTGYRTWYLAVLVLGDSFKVFVVTRDPEMEKPEWAESILRIDDGEIRAVSDAATAFWRFVQDDTPPPVDGSMATTDALREVYAEAAPGTAIDLEPVRDALKRRAEAKADAEAAEARVRECDNEVMAFMGETEAGVTDGWRVTWKNQARRTLDKAKVAALLPDGIPEDCYSTSESRVLRIAAAKPKKAS